MQRDVVIFVYGVIKMWDYFNDLTRGIDDSKEMGGMREIRGVT